MNTRTLFYYMVQKVKPKYFCDIGSMDGGESLYFKKASPLTQVFAFESNPYNYKIMASNQILRGKNIQIFDIAVTNFIGKTKFYILDENSDPGGFNRGTSSLLEPDYDYAPAIFDGSVPYSTRKLKEVQEVNTTMIDKFLIDRASDLTNVVLWIDVEGAGWEVLDGMKNIKNFVSMIHIEVELKPKRKKQKLINDVLQLMESYGFKEIERYFSKGATIGDIIFINKSFPNQLSGFTIFNLKVKAVIFHTIISVIRKVLPVNIYRLLRSYYFK